MVGGVVAKMHAKIISHILVFTCYHKVTHAIQYSEFFRFYIQYYHRCYIVIQGSCVIIVQM